MSNKKSETYVSEYMNTAIEARLNLTVRLSDTEENYYE